MTDVRKRDGRVETFNKAKIQQSILRAGGDEKLAIEVANTVPDEVALTTADIRARAVEELTKRNPEVAGAYENTRRLTARKATDVAPGGARVTEQAMSYLNLEPGDPVQLGFAEKTHDVRAKKGAQDPQSIHLNEEDLRKIGATEGTRIAVRKLS